MQGDRRRGKSSKLKEIDWAEEQRVPAGKGTTSSPLVWLRDDASSSDEEYDKFCEPRVLLLSEVTSETSEAMVRAFFNGHRLSNLVKNDDGDGTFTFVVTFTSNDSALRALKAPKDTQWKTGDTE